MNSIACSEPSFRVSPHAAISEAGISRKIYESAYFARYFAFGIPIGDIADAQIDDEFRTLCTTGTLPADSAITADIEQSTHWSSIPSKVRQHMSVVETASPTAAFGGACFIHRHLRPGGAPHQWLKIAAALLERAVTGADSPTHALRYMRDHSAEFGLVNTTRLLTIMKPEEEEANPAILAASAEIRAAVIGACVADLSLDITDDNSDPPRLLDFLTYLDEELWETLRGYAGTVTLVSVGGLEGSVG
jgi:hypothetical protein